MSEVKIPSLLEMLKAGVHFGHRTSKWHPKMAPYIFAERNGVHIINLEKTQEKLKEALDFIKEVAEKDGIILFLGTKNQAREIIRSAAEECGMPYVIERWLGGTFTNFSVIAKLLKKLEDLEQKQKAEVSYTKKEKLVFRREVEKLQTLIGGIRNLTRVPDAIFIVDIKKEKTAVREALRKKVPIIAICDTNVNPVDIDFPIPANDDAIKSIAMITGAIADTIKKYKKGAKTEEPVESSQKEVKK